MRESEGIRKFGSDRVQAPCTLFRFERSERARARGVTPPADHGTEAPPPACAQPARSRVRGGSPAARCNAKFILCYNENLVAEAEENGLGGEFVDWGISISKWRADPVAIALYGWLLENEPEGMAAKSERQIDWEMGIVGMASSRRREEAVKSWRRSHGAAERENDGFFVTLGLSNAERSAANEAMIAEIPEVAFF